MKKNKSRVQKPKFLLNYECPCGYTWKTYWEKYSKDQCRECGRHVDPKEKIQ
tara:strand:+ start:353 stop:508 length:156 start_codon:yes stop_codon:yes gene_type:complete